MSDTLGQDVCFPSTASIREAGAMRDALVAAFAGSGPIRLDLTKVSVCDVTLVQLLLAAKAAAVSGGRALSVALSPAVERLLLRAGLSDRPDALGAEGSGDASRGARP